MQPSELRPYTFSPSVWTCELRMERLDDKFYSVSPRFTDGADGTRTMGKFLGCAGPFVFFEDFMAPGRIDQASVWLELFEAGGDLKIPLADGETFLEQFFRSPGPPLSLPEEFRFRDLTAPRPTARLLIERHGRSEHLRATLEFRYGERLVPQDFANAALVDLSKRERMLRDLAEEERLRHELTEMTGGSAQNIDPARLPEVVEKALAAGWEVLAHKAQVRAAKSFELSATASGIDWFDVTANLEFDGGRGHLPELIEALREGRGFVRLGDGSLGVLPDDWKRRLAPLLDLGRGGPGSPGSLRLNRLQMLLLTARLEGNASFRPDRKLKSLHDLLKRCASAARSTPERHSRASSAPTRKKDWPGSPP
ncbi:MAG: hypothetical protein HC902_11815 [Calothrix sp. SM1_5_4]|nr:hypothetical protein [Calothrix sp. SM1_5_4]